MDEYINRKLITDSLEEIYNDIPVWEDDDDWNKGIKEGIWVAMSCINALPSAQPEYTIEMQESDIDEAMKLVRDARVTILPSAQPEGIRGRWIKMSDADGAYYCCSECGKELYRLWSFDRQFDLVPHKESIAKTNYCPNCGADMRGIQDA